MFLRDITPHWSAPRGTAHKYICNSLLSSVCIMLRFPMFYKPMKNPKKIIATIAAGLLAAGTLAFAQDAAPPPPPPPPPPAAAPAGGSGGGAGRAGGGGGRRGGGAAAPAQLAPADLATINKVLKDLIGKADPDAQKIIDANPTWNPITPAGGGAAGARGGRAGGGGRRGGAGGGAGGPGGAAGGAGGAGAAPAAGGAAPAPGN